MNKVCKKCGHELKENETVCPKCSANQKSNKGLLFGIIISIIIIVILVWFIKSKTNKPSVSFDSDEITISEENFDTDTIQVNSNETFTFRGKSIELTPAGQLTTAEKGKNIAQFNNRLSPEIAEVSFDDDDPIFTEENFGSDVIEKSYTINMDFDVRSVSLSGYNLGNMSGDKLKNILVQMSKKLGTIYLPYGFPKEAEMKNRNISLEVSVRNILANIPSDMLPYAKFYLAGHTDTTYYQNEGPNLTDVSHDFNQLLSERRSEYIKQIMIGYGINPKAIVTEGFSFDKLSKKPDDNKHSENQKLNRRVEISVVFDE